VFKIYRKIISRQRFLRD